MLFIGYLISVVKVELRTKDYQLSSRLGGTDAEEWLSYKRESGPPYFNKPDHIERSTYHSPNHASVKRIIIEGGGEE